MKILYIYDKYPATYQKYLLNLLVMLRKKLTVSTMTYSKTDASDYSVVSYGFRDKLQRMLYKFKLSKYPSLDIQIMSKFDIVHLQHSFLWRKLSALETITKLPKVVVTLRGGDTYIKPWLGSDWQYFYKEKHSLVDAFIVMSQHQKYYLKRWQVPEEKIHVIPISFGSHSNALPKYPNTEKLILVSAFRMTWEKNIEGTIEFARSLKEQNIDFEFDIYGDGNDLGQLYYLIDRFGLHEYVFPKGKVDNDILKQKLPTYDFFVQLSVSEAFPTSVLEAQSVGLPCVVSDSGGLPEAVIKDRTALVASYSDFQKLTNQIIALWKDKDLYFQFSQDSIKYVNENFTIEKEVDKLENLYKSL
ncbi:glycosyltransferase family 4 protein [Flavobacterium adhaerens]|uniref:glycosyltransferase family 4 protein n=1 Tax=Flavobacterium adhaerens TaxID=3149043 RepID=UPI0032B4D0D5